jgi:hypothetical protein
MKETHDVACARMPRRKISHILTGRLGTYAPPTLIALMALFWWMVFYPGLLSFDSVDQYRQGVTGQYSTTRPPIMAIAVAMTRSVGGDIQHLMLIQCEAALLGVYFLGVSFLRWLQPSTPVLALRLAVLGAIALMLLPFSPLPHYLVTFWTDVWVMVSLCWIGALWLQIMRDSSLTSGNVFRLLLILWFSVVMVLVRHNSVVLLPVATLMFAIAAGRMFSWKAAVAAAALPLLLYVTAHSYIKRTLHPVETPIHNMVFAYDLAGLCIRFPELRSEFPHTARHLLPDSERLYYPGFMNYYGDIIDGNVYARPDLLQQEFTRAILTHPLKFASVKAGEVECHFVKNPVQKAEFGIHDNEFGLAPSAHFAQVKVWLRKRLCRTFEHCLLGMAFARHGVWFGVNVLALLLILGTRSGRKDPRWRVTALLLLLPLTYYGSFFLASLSSEFRYMYPSDVFVQILTIAWLVAYLMSPLWKKVQAKTIGQTLAGEEMSMGPTEKRGDRTGIICQ